MKINYALLTLAIGLLLFASMSPRAVSHPLQDKPVQAKPSAPPVTPCDVDAYVVEEDEKGLNVRSGPGKDQPVIAVVSGEVDEQLIHITGASGGWVRISTAKALDGKSLFKGTGWVLATKLGTSVRPDSKGSNQARLYQQPDTKSTVVGNVPAEDGARVVGCKDKWVQVKSQKLTGWLSPEGQCPNPVTACP